MNEADRDRQWVLAARDGNRHAFEQLLEHHYLTIHRLAFRFTGHRDEADDLTQDICTALPVKLASFRHESRFSTWLYRVVFNAALDRRRRHESHSKAAAAWGELERNRGVELANERQRREWLIDAMQGLGNDLRDTLLLSLAGLTHNEIAAMLDIADGTVSWRLSEARKHLSQVDVEHRT